LLVVGSINLDISVRVPRLSAPGETLMGKDLQISPGGKGANQAHAARLDGATVRLVGAVGADGFAAPALQALRDSGVDLQAVQSLADARTGAALIQVTDDGDNAIALAPGANDRMRPQDLETQVDPATWASHDLLLQWELPPATAMRAAELARATGSRVCLNLAPARILGELDLTLLDWCVLNEGELSALAAHLGLTAAGPAAARALAQRVGQGVVLTLGAAGVYACPRHDTAASAGATAQGLPIEGLHLPAHAIAAVDTTGAGDTFCGVFAAALAAGQSVQHALHRANAAAALACTQRGAQAAQPTAQAIDAVLAATTATQSTKPTPGQPKPNASLARSA
jgi:ribokinase